MSLKSLSVKIGADTSGFSEGLNAVNNGIHSVQETTSKMSESFASHLSSFASECKKQSMNAVKAFRSAWNEIDHTSSQTNKNRSFGLKNIFSDFSSSAQSAKKDVSRLNNSLSETSSVFNAANDGMKKIVSSAVALVSVISIVRGLAEAFQAYTSLESNVNRVTDLFADSARYIQYFAQTTAKSLGMAENSVYEYSATYGNLFKNITSDSYENAKVTIAMLQASAVVASKTGRTMEDVMERIRSGLLGNTEAIEDLGINVNVAMLEVTDAFRQIADGRSWEQLTFYEQQQIRTLAILEQASGNFGDEIQQGSAYSVSVLEGAFQDLISTAGEFVNEVFQPVIKYLTTSVQSVTTVLQSLNKDGLQPIVNVLHNVVQYAVTALKSLVNLIGIDINFSETDSGMPESFSASADSSGEVSENMSDTSDTAKKLKKTLAGFDELNVLAVPDTDSSLDKNSPDKGKDKSVFSSLPDLEIPDESVTIVDIDTSRLEKNLSKIKNKLKPLTDSLSDLWDALKPFAKNVGEGLFWFCKNVLLPLGEWSFNILLPFALSTLSSAIEILNAVVEGFKPMGEWLWNNFIKPVSEWTGQIITSGLEKLADALESIAKWCSENKTSASVIFGLSGAVLLLNAIIKTSAISTFIGKLSTAITAIEQIDVTIGIIIAGIAGWVYAITELWKNWDDIISVVKKDGGVFNFIGNWIDDCRKDIEDFFNSSFLGKKWYDFWSGLGEIVYTVFKEIPPKVRTAGTYIILGLCKAVSEGITKIKKIFEKILITIKNIFSGISEWFREIFQTAWNNITGIFSVIGNWFSERYNNVTTSFSDVSEWFKETFQTALDNIVNIFSEIGNWFSERWNDIKNAFADSKNWFKNKFQESYDNITGIFKNIGKWFSDKWKDIKNAFSETDNWFKLKFQKSYDNIKNIFMGIGNWFLDRWRDIKNNLANIPDWFKEKFQTAWENITGIFSVIGDWFSGRYNDITTAFSDISEWFKNNFQSAYDNIIYIFANIGNWFSERYNDITTSFSNIGEWFREKFQSAWDNITSIFSSIGNWFSDRRNDITSAFDNIENWFSEKFQSAYDNITGIFSNIGGWFDGIWDTLSESAKSGLNWIIEKINGFTSKLNSFINFDFPIPLSGEMVHIGFEIPPIPPLAKGGIVNSPTLAMIGEAGKEAVLPLQNNTGWISDIAEKLWGSLKNVFPTEINLVNNIPAIKQASANSPIYNNYKYETYNIQRNFHTAQNDKRYQNLPAVNIYLYPNSRAFKRDVLNVYREEIARGGKIG